MPVFIFMIVIDRLVVNLSQISLSEFAWLDILAHVIQPTSIMLPVIATVFSDIEVFDYVT